MNAHPRYPCAVFGVVLLLFPTMLDAGTHTWKGGGGDNLWSNEDNWSSGGSPMDDDSKPRVLIFPASAQSYHTVCDESYFSVDVIYIRGSYTFSHTDNGDDNLLYICVHPADNIVIDSAASPTVTFDSSFIVIWACGAQRGRVRMTSGTLRILGPMNITATMEGTGTVSFEGGTNLGADLVLQGLTLRLNKTGNYTSGGVKLTASQGASVLVERNSQFRGYGVSLDNVAVTMSAGVSDWVGPLHLSNGAAVNALAPGANMILNDTVSGGDGSNHLLGRFDLAGMTREFRVANSGDTLSLSGSLADGMTVLPPGTTGSVRKTGAGDLRINAAGTFHGPVVVEEGTLLAEHDAAFGAAGGGVSVGAYGRVELHDVDITGETLTLGGTLATPGGSSSWTGGVVLQSTARRIEFNGQPDPGTLKIAGVISGPGTLLTESPGTLELGGSGSNTFTGETVIRNGIVRLNKSSGNAIPGPLTIIPLLSYSETRVTLAADNQIADNAMILLDGYTGVLDLAGHDETIGGMLSLTTGGSEVWLGNSRTGNATFTLGGNNLSTSYYGKITGAPGMTLVKAGTGTFRTRTNLSSEANTYDGQTRVIGGTFIVDTMQRADQVVVKPGATLGGEGVVGPVILDGGYLHAGHLTTGPLFANPAGGHWLADLLGPAPLPGGYNRAHVNGTLSLVNSTLTAALAFQPSTGARFAIIANDGTEPVMGTFTGLSEGAALNVSGKPFTISYQGGDGNDVELRYAGTGGPPRILSVSYDRPADFIHLQALATPGEPCQWQVSSTLNSWSTFANGIPDSAGLIKLDQSLGLHAPRLFFRLFQP